MADGTPPPLHDDSARTRRAQLSKLRHDLRTPINAILGYSEILIEDARDRADAASLPDLEKIHAAGVELLARVNSVLANEKITADDWADDVETVAATLHYELRTPTDAVIGYSELLLEEARAHADSAMIADLEKIRAAAHLFIETIGELVKYTIVQADILGMDEKTASSEAMVEQAVETIKPLDETDAPVKERGKILVVDDSSINRDILMHRLTRQGHTVVTAEDGRRALALIAEQSFDLVLLDILMPELNGFQVLQTLKADRKLRELPVIMISALDELDSVVRCIEMGAEDYLPKPFNPVLLNARIESSLEKKRLRDQQRELFGKFATPQVVDELMATGFSLGGKMVQATAMFSDIRSFTTIAEAQTPAETIRLLNSYFGYVMEAIASEGGIVNQMVGDGLMAIFGAPLPQADHRARAVRAALKMMQRIREFNEAQQQERKRTIEIGIGIASGQVIAGFTGTEMRATYTCVGDTVNLAARLEAHTKVVKQPILIDENTRQGLDDAFRAEPQGSVQLKGKTQAVQIFSVPPELTA
jgi:class 3 adenylate cyclase/signal transduction histidine kinase